MSKRLILIRHAKSSWDDPLDDHERVLSPRGEAAAEAIGNWLQTHGYHPDVILASDSTRTRQTAEVIARQLSPEPPLELKSTFYHASPDTLLEDIVKTPAEVVAIVGHNPGIGMLAQGLVHTAPAHHRFRDYPTCATTIIDFDGTVAIGEGICTDFIVPRDLTD